MTELFIKTVDPSKIDLEAELQDVAWKCGFAPEIFKLTDDTIYMEKIDGHTLADVYGEDPNNVPPRIWRKIRDMVTHLWEEEGIEYVDITPYNFIETDNRIYMIDFGDAKYSDTEPMNWFLKEFIEGENSWNPDFK